MHQAGDDVVERRARRAQQNLNVAERLRGLVGNGVADQLAGVRVEPALTGEEDPVANREAERVRPGRRGGVGRDDELAQDGVPPIAPSAEVA